MAFAAPDESLPSRRWTIALLAAVYACHLVDRSIISMILEPIRRDLKLSDGELGLLAGLAFALGYAASVLPLGALADRFSRRLLLTGLLSLWSGLTLVCGLAASFPLLLLARLGVGMAEAGGQPVSMSIVGDIAPPERRAGVVGLVHLGIPAGTLLGGVIGAFVATRYGWRETLFIAGAPGLLLAGVIAFTLKEPVRTLEDATGVSQRPLGLGEFLRFLAGRPSLCCAIAGVVVLWFVSGSYGAFMVSLLVRVDHLPLKLAALLVPGLGAIFGAVGNLLSGVFADRFARGAPDRLAFFAAGAALLHLPLSLVAVLTPIPYLPASPTLS